MGMTLAQDPKAKEPAKKPNVIEIDLSKLPPDVAKAVRDSLKASEEVKPLSLTEAIGIAEKSSKGQAVKAERDGDGADARFKIDVIAKDGTRSRINLNATGKPIEGESPSAGKKGAPEGKGPPPGKGLGKLKKQPPADEPKKESPDKKPTDLKS